MKIVRETDHVSIKNVVILVLMPAVLMPYAMLSIIRRSVRAHKDIMVPPTVNVYRKWMLYQYPDQSVLRIVTAVTTRHVLINNVRTLVNWTTYVDKMPAAMSNFIDLCVFAMKDLPATL